MGWGALDEGAPLDPVPKGCSCEATDVPSYRLARCVGDWSAMSHQAAKLYVLHLSVESDVHEGKVVI